MYSLYSSFVEKKRSKKKFERKKKREEKEGKSSQSNGVKKIEVDHHDREKSKKEEKGKESAERERQSLRLGFWGDKAILFLVPCEEKRK